MTSFCSSGEQEELDFAIALSLEQANSDSGSAVSPSTTAKKRKYGTTDTCKQVGCSCNVYSDSSGCLYDFCGKTHALEYQKGINKEGSSSSSSSSSISSISSSNRSSSSNNRSSSSGDQDLHLDMAIALSLAEDQCAHLSSGDAAVGNTSLDENIAHFIQEEDWTCSLCTTPNHFMTASCAACEHKKADTDNARQIQEYWEKTDEAAATWMCATCNTESSKSTSTCKQCLEPMGATAEDTSALWCCSKCTFDNSSGDAQCYMCGSDVLPACYTLNPAASKSQCGLPGCASHASHYGFCSSSHFDKAIQRRMIPPFGTGIEVVFVGDTGDYTAHLLRASHPRHKSVKEQFFDSWQKLDDGRPVVERIFWIRMNPSLLANFEAKKKEIGNVRRRFHGTSQSGTCLFGTDQSRPPCNEPECRVCSICRTGFKLSLASTGSGGTAWLQQNIQLRYGKGMYFSSVSSKSNDYNKESERVRPHTKGRERRWRSMFLCNVIVGKPHITQEGFLPPDQCPPDSFDSVIGEVGKDLNYDEVVVYNESQAIPSYLIIYSLDKCPSE